MIPDRNRNQDGPAAESQLKNLAPASSDAQIRDLALRAFDEIIHAVKEQNDVCVIGAIAQDAVLAMTLEHTRLEEETRKTVGWRLRNIRYNLFGDNLGLEYMTDAQRTLLYNAVDQEFGIKVTRDRPLLATWILLEEIEEILNATHQHT